MAKSNTRRNKSKQQDPTVSESEKHVGPDDGFCPPASPTRPGGKLGLIVGQLATEAGASADELAKATGWQRHTVLGALSRLRSRGFEMQLRATRMVRRPTGWLGRRPDAHVRYA